MRSIDRKVLLDEVQQAIDELQPNLKIKSADSGIIISGVFSLTDQEGKFDEFEVFIIVDYRYPVEEPIVFETAERIPRVSDRHIYPKSGHCCLGVWEEWLVNEKDNSFGAFLQGPLNSFFVGQCYFEIHKVWPFGQRNHDLKGLVEAYSDLLGIENNPNKVKLYLRILSHDWPKGHSNCPCGSGESLKNCHQNQLDDLHQRLPPKIAKRMTKRLKQFSNTSVKS